MRTFDFPQYGQAWWDQRCGVPTASEFSRIITPEKAEFSKQAIGYACDLIADQHDPLYGLHDDVATSAMRKGSRMEPKARRYYEFERGVKVQIVGFCMTDDGRFGCSPDALVGDDGVLELKSPNHSTQVQYLLAGVLPKDYKAQCHGHLIVTGRDWCDFCSCVDGLPPFMVRVEPDEYTDNLRAALDQFWTLLQETKAKLNLPEPEIDRSPITVPAEMCGLND